MTNCGMVFWRFQFDSLCFAYASPICKWSSSRLDSIGEFQVSRLHQKKFMSGCCQRVKGALKKCSWTSEFKMLWTDFVSWLSCDMLMLSKHETFHTFTRRIQMAVEILISKSSWSSWHKCGPWRNFCEAITQRHSSLDKAAKCMWFSNCIDFQKKNLVKGQLATGNGPQNCSSGCVVACKSDFRVEQPGLLSLQTLLQRSSCNLGGWQWQVFFRHFSQWYSSPLVWMLQAFFHESYHHILGILLPLLQQLKSRSMSVIWKNCSALRVWDWKEQMRSKMPRGPRMVTPTSRSMIAQSLTEDMTFYSSRMCLNCMWKINSKRFVLLLSKGNQWPTPTKVWSHWSLLP